MGQDLGGGGDDVGADVDLAVVGGDDEGAGQHGEDVGDGAMTVELFGVVELAGP